MLEKSAAAVHASRARRASRRSRLRRSSGSSALTVTLRRTHRRWRRKCGHARPSRRRNPRWRYRQQRRCAASASSAAASARSSACCAADAGSGGAVMRPVLRLLDAQDVGGAAIGGEQVGAILGAEQAPPPPRCGRAGGRDRHPRRRRTPRPARRAARPGAQLHAQASAKKSSSSLGDRAAPASGPSA